VPCRWGGAPPGPPAGAVPRGDPPRGRGGGDKSQALREAGADERALGRGDHATYAPHVRGERVAQRAGAARVGWPSCASGARTNHAWGPGSEDFSADGACALAQRQTTSP
ncbi:MAG: hypothetical protein ACR2LH_05120, partial [Thermoleophilaceae bacterium]